MRFPSITALAALLTSVSAAVYPRQSGTACTYKCPDVAGYDVTSSAGAGAVILCDYQAATFTGMTVSTCAYSIFNGDEDESQSVEGLLECPRGATCETPSRRRRNALPVSPPRAAPPQPVPNSLKMRGQLRKRKD